MSGYKLKFVSFFSVRCKEKYHLPIPIEVKILTFKNITII